MPSFTKPCSKTSRHHCECGLNAEIITNDVTGYLSPSASFKHLKQTMEKDAARKEWGTMAEAARESILESRKLGYSTRTSLMTLNMRSIDVIIPLKRPQLLNKQVYLRCCTRPCRISKLPSSTTALMRRISYKFSL